MQPFHLKTAVEQITEHLRREILEGGVSGKMLGVGTETVIAAMEILEREKLLVSQGPRRGRKIMRPEGGDARSGLQVSILHYEASDAHDEHMVAMRHRLGERGHRVAIAVKNMMDLKFDVERVARLVKQTGGDAWVIRSGSRPVLEWFAAQPVPAFAMFGRQTNLPIAGLVNLKSPAMVEALRRLVDLGHRRISLLVREERRKPNPGFTERRFLEELERLGIQVGPYNLPDWEDEAQSFRRCLQSLFSHTPPTALLFGEPTYYFAALQFFSEIGIVVPHDVSLLVLEDHPAFEWFVPQVSHLHTDTRRWVRRVVQWVDHVASGQEDRRETLIKSEFVAGGTIRQARS
jgi:DNA-binding LacI/PurR family transcriptional regulator